MAESGKHGTTLDHLRYLAQAAKAFTGGLVTALAESTVGAIMDEWGTSVPLTLSPSVWQKSDAPADAAYPYFYIYTLADVTDRDRVDAVLSPSSLPEAAACGLCPVCESGEGSVTFRAERAPAAALSGEYRILKGKENG